MEVDGLSTRMLEYYRPTKVRRLREGARHEKKMSAAHPRRRIRADRRVCDTVARAAIERHLPCASRVVHARRNRIREGYRHQGRADAQRVGRIVCANCRRK